MLRLTRLLDSQEVEAYVVADSVTRRDQEVLVRVASDPVTRQSRSRG